MVLQSRSLRGSVPQFSESIFPGSSASKKETPKNSPNFDLKLVGFIHDVFYQATDTTMVLPMILASPLGGIAETSILRSFLSKPAASWLGRVFTLKALPLLGGFAAETVGFSLGSRALNHYLHGPVSWDASSILKDTLMTGMNLALLKGAGFAGRRGVQWARGPQVDHRTMFWTGQVSGYLGLVGSHGIQAKISPETQDPNKNIWIDALGTQIALGIGGHGGRILLGEKFQTFEQNLKVQAHQIYQEVNFPFMDSGGREAVLVAGGGPYSGRDVFNFDQILSKDERESSSTHPSETIESSSRIRKPQKKFFIPRLLRALRKNTQSELLKHIFSEKSDEELSILLEEELRRGEGLTDKQAKIVHARLFADPPKKHWEMFKEFGVSRSLSYIIVLKASERALIRNSRRHYEDLYKEDPRNFPVIALDLPRRVLRWLGEKDVKTLGALEKFTEYDLLKVKHSGGRTLAKIKAVLAEKDSYLKGSPLLDEISPMPTTPRMKPIIPIDSLPLSIRVSEGLANHRIESLDQVTQFTESDLLKWKNFGRRSIEELKLCLNRYGYSLANRGENLLNQEIQSILEKNPNHEGLKKFISEKTSKELFDLFKENLGAMLPIYREIVELRFFSDPPWGQGKIAEKIQIPSPHMNSLIRAAVHHMLRHVDAGIDTLSP